MSLLNYAKRVVVRRLTLLALAALLAWLGFGNARAQALPSYAQCMDTTISLGATPWCPSVSAAQASVVAYVNARVTESNKQACVNRMTITNETSGTYGSYQRVAIPYRRYSFQSCAGTAAVEGTIARYVKVPTCPAGQEFSEVTMACVPEACPAGAIRMTNGKCSPTPEQCENFNDAPGFKDVGLQVIEFGSMCRSGCVYAAGESAATTAVIGALGGSVTNGSFRFTGATCDVSDPDAPETPEPPPNPLPQEKCIPAGGGMTMCVRNDGKHCYNADTGKQICWRPGETGNKANGPDRQDRGPGNTPPPVPPKAPNGDDLVPNGSPVTTTTTIGSQTITTTTTNSTTVNGTNAGPPSDGSSGGDGEGEEESEGSSSGGEGCDSPPVGQGGDPLLQRMIYQQWKSRCPHGENELPDPSIAGDQGGDEHPTVDSLVVDSGVPGGIGGGGDSSGFGLARGCPLESSIPELVIAGTTIEMPWKITTCEWLRMLSAMILMAGHIAWALIVVSIGKGT